MAPSRNQFYLLDTLRSITIPEKGGLEWLASVVQNPDDPWQGVLRMPAPEQPVTTATAAPGTTPALNPLAETDFDYTEFLNLKTIIERTQSAKIKGSLLKLLSGHHDGDEGHNADFESGKVRAYRIRNDDILFERLCAAEANKKKLREWLKHQGSDDPPICFVVGFLVAEQGGKGKRVDSDTLSVGGSALVPKELIAAGVQVGVAAAGGGPLGAAVPASAIGDLGAEAESGRHGTMETHAESQGRVIFAMQYRTVTRPFFAGPWMSRGMALGYAPEYMSRLERADSPRLSEHSICIEEDPLPGDTPFDELDDSVEGVKEAELEHEVEHEAGEESNGDVQDYYRFRPVDRVLDMDLAATQADVPDSWNMVEEEEQGTERRDGGEGEVEADHFYISDGDNEAAVPDEDADQDVALDLDPGEIQEAVQDWAEGGVAVEQFDDFDLMFVEKGETKEAMVVM